jgi:hypothetical protein
MATDCQIVQPRQPQTQRTWLDWLRMEHEIEKPSSAGKEECRTQRLHALRDEYTSTIGRSRAAETLKFERTLSDLVNQAYGLTPAEIELVWETAPHGHRAALHNWGLIIFIPER